MENEDNNMNDSNSNYSDNDEESSNNNNEYFESYFDLNVHDVMLKDTTRTLAYRKAIEENVIDFKDKIVMDVGAGTGILSMFAAKCGAAKVYAIEASQMAPFTKSLVKANHLDHIITVVHKRVEDIDESDIPQGKVDVIISEWMGFYLLHESMLESVLDARDRWLKPNGILFPTKGDIKIAPVNLEQLMHERVGHWSDVYGFDFSIFKDMSMHLLQSQPLIEYLKGDTVISEPKDIIEIDFTKVTKEELRDIVVKNIPFSIDDERCTLIHGFAIWFNCYFVGSNSTVRLDTAPGMPYTHWKQTTILLPDVIDVRGAGQIEINIDMKQDEINPRFYELSLSFPDDDDQDENANEDQ
ncbi:putative protein arginine methyltransferase [Heterostelium album PN500]|uniref:type I protein arginine methyltransferase n=1 Tax=Heterostelium pallidum (strain ATCC 26659 / Pp 5 / PN500) TaxID=670386 RepID=D3AWQ4_HETP5|nr:putative protein arginine methyltransferase [Heterostelium album PN500]EFA86727.1 putative protein arginine methyltransferase [Heterostelium album PN500]|eukprot:XP_020438831.1 putative protein arginine methyltransferase [Heterostelium album PN500]